MAILPNKSNVDDLATKTSQMYDIAINFCNIPHFPTNKRNIVWRQKSFENVSYLLFSCDFAPLYEELRDEAQTCYISLESPITMKDTDLGLLVFLILITSMAIGFLVGNFFRLIVLAVDEDLMVSMITYTSKWVQISTEVIIGISRCG